MKYSGDDSNGVVAAPAHATLDCFAFSRDLSVIVTSAAGGTIPNLMRNVSNICPEKGFVNGWETRQILIFSFEMDCNKSFLAEQ